MADHRPDAVAALREAGRDLDLPAASDPVDAALARIRRAPHRAGPRWHRLVAAAAAVALAVALAAPGTRGAVARLLGVGGVRIAVTGETPGDLPRELDLGRPVPVDEAVAAGGDAFAVPFPAPPGDPALAFAGRPRGGVSLVWPAGDGLPALAGSGAGVVLTVFPADAGAAEPPAVDGPAVEKEATAGTRVTTVAVGPHRGYWLSGAPHEVRESGADGGDGDGARLAGDTLIWSDGERTWRLESALDREAAVALAEALTGAG